MFPLCRWLGGKTFFVKSHGPLLLDHLEQSGGRFIEPFFGGGSVGLFVGSRYPKQIIVSDVVEPLMNFYRVLKEQPVDLARTLAQIGIEYGLDEKAYYAVRDEKPEEPLFRAAQFLYLNALNFQGLYRENKSGTYNVPAGSRAKNGTAKLPERKMIDLASKALELADIRCGDFEAVIDEAEEFDFCLIDSPYVGTFNDYSSGGFSKEDHERLALALHRANERGATFLAFNSMNGSVEEEFGVRYWYGEWATIIEADEPRRVAANGDRVDAKCCMITNDVALAEKL